MRCGESGKHIDIRICMKRKKDEGGYYYTCPHAVDRENLVCKGCIGYFDDDDIYYNIYDKLNKLRIDYLKIENILGNQKLTRWIKK